MEIYPHLLARMILLAVFTGGVLGILHDVMKTIRIIVLADDIHNIQESRPLRLHKKIEALIGKQVYPFGYGKGRKPIRKVFGNVVVFFEDVIFFAISGCAVSILIYAANDGVFRLLAIFGVGIGFFAYYFTISRFLLRIVKIAAYKVSVVITYVALILWSPIVFTYKSTKKIKKKPKNKEKQKCPRKTKALKKT